MSETCSQIRQDRDMLVDLLRSAGRDGDYRLTLSSVALLLEVFADSPVPLALYPRYAGGLRACQATAHRLPTHRRTEGAAILDRFHTALREECARRGSHAVDCSADSTCWRCGDPLPSGAAS